MKDAVRNLRADRSIHILKADKGNATVVLDRVEYDNKVLALLNTQTYKELKSFSLWFLHVLICLDQMRLPQNDLAIPQQHLLFLDEDLKKMHKQWF